MRVLCARPTMLLSFTEQASSEAYTTLPSRARGQVRQPVAGSAPKGDTKALPGLSQVFAYAFMCVEDTWVGDSGTGSCKATWLGPHWRATLMLSRVM